MGPQMGRRKGRRTGRWATLSAWLWLVAGLSACAPSQDWRSFQPDGWPLQLSLPCRPAAHSRRVRLGPQDLQVDMLQCESDGLHYAVLGTRLNDPAQVGATLLALAQASQRNLQAQVLARQAAGVPGMTPQAQALRLQLQGRSPDGQPRQMDTVLFASGLRVFQASVLGPALSPAQRDPFFQGLAVRP